jgi:protein PET117
MSRAAKATLVGSVILCGVTVWGVHYLQRKELDVSVAVCTCMYNILRLAGQDMYQGVLRDDERRAKKQQERREQLEESAKKREVYENVQRVGEET